jgi:hypothetical protein
MDKKQVSEEQKAAYDRPEYVTVPDALLEDTETLKPYLRMSYEYVTSLKPNPTTKPKKK